jgi:Glycosyl hydrolase family 26
VAVKVDQGSHGRYADVCEMGVYRGSANPSGVGAFGAWVGRRPGVAVDFLAKGSWSEISGAEWWADGWAGSGYRVVFSVPLLPDSGGSLAEGAQGAFDGHFRRLAEVLVEGGQGDAILRLGWEMNGDWYRWSIKGGEDAFAAYWRRVVDVMRSVSPAFRFDFTVSMGGSVVDGERLDPAAAYPGDDYVDFIGMDVYDQGLDWGLTAPFGLEWHRDFAREHGKPMTIPEWGLKGRDDPEFVERMHDWIERNPVAYHAYFDFEEHELARYPRASERFRELFGAPS